MIEKLFNRLDTMIMTGIYVMYGIVAVAAGTLIYSLISLMIGN